MTRNYFMEGLASIGQGLASIGEGLASIVSSGRPRVQQTFHQPFRHSHTSTRSFFQVVTPEGVKDYSHVTIDSPEADRLALADILDSMAETKEETDASFAEMNAAFERAFGNRSAFRGSGWAESAKEDRARAAALRKGR